MLRLGTRLRLAAGGRLGAIRGWRVAGRLLLAGAMSMFVLGVVGFGAVALADGGTQVSGLSDPTQPLTIAPSTDPVVGSGVDLTAGARVFFIGAMPRAMTVRWVTIGDLARDSSCGQDANVDLLIYRFPDGSDLQSGDLVAQSSGPQPLGTGLGRVRWLVDPTTLAQGGTYAFAVRAVAGSSCGLAAERSWAHNGVTVDGGGAVCASLQDGSGRMRLWHQQDASDSAGCSMSVLNFDPSMPTGWEELDSATGGVSVNTSSGACGTDLGAVEMAWSSSSVVCQFPQFAGPGGSAGVDGWYYGLPWNGLGLDGGPRDLYLSLEPDSAPIVTSGDASGVSSDSATVSGTVNPGGSPTGYHFEWGTDTSYGSSKPIPDADAGSDSSDDAVSARIHGLQPDTTYHYRLVAAHGTGAPVQGSDQTFATGAGVSPVSTTAPSISGTLGEGDQLEASAGGWSGTSPISYSYQWQRCDAQGASCIDLDGVHSARYVVGGGDLGSTLRVVITATNVAGSAIASSDPTAVVAVAPTPPGNESAPKVWGRVVEGQALSAAPGSWSGDDPISYGYQWQRCDQQGASCQDITGATADSYALGVADQGSTIVLHVVATNAAGSASAVSAATAPVVASPILNTVAPAITVTATVNGDVLITDPGSWSGDSGLSYTYQWQACDETGQGCTDLMGATTDSYALGDTDVGSTIRVVVTASSSSDAGTGASAATSVIAASAPASATGPSISGATASGSLLEASPGTWSGVGPVSVIYQWQRCDQNGQSCADIDGATGSMYLAGAADVGETLRVTLTASNTDGSAMSVSGPTDVLTVGAGTLGDTVAPTIAGLPVVGQSLSADPGSWTSTGSISYGYQWQSCDVSGEACTDIAAATSQTYTPMQSDVGAFLQVLVTATDQTGPAYATAAMNQSVATADGPAIDALPVLSGTAQQAQQLSVSTGSWSGPGPISYGYRWQQCDGSGQNCGDVPNATLSSYTATKDEIGSTLRVVVTATGAQSSTSVVTSTSDTVVPATLANVSPPTVTGQGYDGYMLTASPGVWSASGSISYAYQWRSCDPGGENCQDIAGATDSTYALGDSDVGSTVRVLVSASSDWGTRRMTSEPTVVITITQTAPVNTRAPALSGAAIDWQSLSADQGGWSGAAPISYSYQWQRCDQSGLNCTDIADTNYPSYGLIDDDVGSTDRVAVTATNSLGSVTAVSAVSAIIAAAAPMINDTPYVYGDTMPGYVLNSYTGYWTGTAPISYSYQWQSCDQNGQNCADIPGATNDSYTVAAGDVGSTLVVAITATNATAAVTSASPPTAAITAVVAPSNNWAPYITGTPDKGDALAVGWTGGWTPDPTSYAYQWQSCDQNGQNCADLAGATQDQYTLAPSDVGSTVRLAITATDPAGSATAYSLASSVIVSGPPAISSGPWAEGAPELGAQLWSDPGSWSGSGPITFAYQWQSCDQTGQNCADIAGATADTYTLLQGNVGSTVQLVVTASGPDGTTSATSNTTSVVVSGAPSSLTAPIITGAQPGDPVFVGSTLSTTAGGWDQSNLRFSYQWQRCDPQGADCQDIPYGTSSNLEPPWDLGSMLRVEVTALSMSTWQATTVSSSLVGPVLDPNAVYNTALPTIAGQVAVGSFLTADRGSWQGVALQQTTYTYNWERCDSAGTQCTDIPTDDQLSSYVPSTADLGATLRLVVGAVDPYSQQTLTATSDATVPVAAATPPANTSAPTLGGATAADQTINVLDNGTWSGTPTIRFSYQWQRCDSTAGSCIDIPNATESGYVAARADIGSTLVARVTATNGWGDVSADSAPSDVIAAAQPLANVSPPRLTDPGVYPQGASADQGVWIGAPTITTQWQRCDPNNLDPTTGDPVCVDIPGATGYNVGGLDYYSPQAADVGFDLRMVVTATTPEATQTIATNLVGAVVVYPYLLDGTYSGLAVAGQTLTADPGIQNLTGLPTSTEYQFVRHNPDRTTTQLQDGSQSAYTLTNDDIGAQIEMYMTVTVWRADHADVAGTLTTDVMTSGTVDSAVTNDTLPTIRGQVTAGQTLSADPGSWHGGGGALTYSYQWQRCDPTGQSCASINTATEPSYVLGLGDIGSTLQVQVTAANAPGSETAVSPLTAPVAAAAAPTIVSAPTISGDPTEQQTLAADPGGWAGSAPISYSYQWQTCAPDATGCANIQGATDQSYLLGHPNVGHTIAVQVTATNIAGAATNSSAATAVIAPVPAPVNQALPSLTALGPSAPPTTLLTDGGAWQNAPASGLHYQWQRCDTQGANCQDIPYAHANSYALSSDDVGDRLQVRVSATNESGQVSATSELSKLVAANAPTAVGKMIYLSAKRTTIQIANDDGSQPRQIANCTTINPASDGTDCNFYQPEIAADATMLAVQEHPVSRYGNQTGPDEIILMNVDGSDVHNLVAGSQPAWTSDGTQIAYTHTTTNLHGTTATSIEVVHADGHDSNTPTVLVGGSTQAQAAGFSPDGRLLAYAAKDPSTSTTGIYIATATGGHALQLTLPPGVGDATNPVFTADSNSVIFNGQVRGSYPATLDSTVEPYEQQLFSATDIKTAHPTIRKISNDNNSTYGRAQASPDNKTIITTRQKFEVATDGYGYWVDGGCKQAWKINLVGSQAALRADFCAGPAVAVFSPDSQVDDPTYPPTGGGDATYAIAVKYAPLLHVDPNDGFTPISFDWVYSFRATAQYGVPLAPTGNELARTPSQDYTCIGVSLRQRRGTVRTDCASEAFGSLGEGSPGNQILDYPAELTSEPAQQALEETTVQGASGLPPAFDPVIYYVRFKGGPGVKTSDADYALLQRDGAYTLQYWYYYTYNYFASGVLTGGFFGDMHEGDLEHVDITFDSSNTPIYVFMSEHSDGFGCPLDPHHTLKEKCTAQVTYTDGHINVYAAQGDHANYPTCGRQDIHGLPGVVSGAIQDTTCEGGLAGQDTYGGAIDVLSGFTDLGSFDQIADWSCWQGLLGTDTGVGGAPAAPMRQGGFADQKAAICNASAAEAG